MENEDRTIVCPNCGKSQSADTSNCFRCGYNFSQQWPPIIERPSLSSQREAKVNIIEALLGIIIGFLCIIPGILLYLIGPAAILIICLSKNVNFTFRKFVIIGACIAGFIIVAAFGSCIWSMRRL